MLTIGISSWRVAEISRIMISFYKQIIRIRPYFIPGFYLFVNFTKRNP